MLVVDQNDDERTEPILQAHPSLEIERLRGPRGLSRARNAALPLLRADVVGFPDDDCTFPADLLERVAAQLADRRIDGVTGRAPTPATWKRDAAMLTRDNLWNRAISFTIFLRRDLVERVGAFDESLGLPSSSGEEIDYLIRAIDSGSEHRVRPDDRRHASREAGRSDGGRGA